MTCVKPCSQEYIGESKRPLHIRINEHGDPNREPPSAISDHIENCTHFQSELSKQFGMTPTSKQKNSLLKTLFTPIATNNYRCFKRKRLEAIAITILGPVLNNQVKHNKVHIISSL